MLSELLSLQPGMIVALVGAGGKTTTMYRLAAEQAARGARVITTTTTHIYPPAPAQTGELILATEREPMLERAAAALARHAHITVASAQAAEGKLRGIPPEWVADLHALPGVGCVLVEADGARGRLVKAPAAYEPVIPLSANLALLLASAEALGQPLSETIAHRLERVETVTGLKAGETLTPAALARLETHPEGALKGVPPGVPAILVLTHVDDARQASAEETAAHALGSDRLAGVVLCTVEQAALRQAR